MPESNIFSLPIYVSELEVQSKIMQILSTLSLLIKINDCFSWPFAVFLSETGAI